MNVIAESRATASARAQGVGPFRSQNTLVIVEAIIAGFGWISLSVKTSAPAQRDDVTNVLVAENVATSDYNC